MHRHAPPVKFFGKRRHSLHRTCLPALLVAALTLGVISQAQAKKKPKAPVAQSKRDDDGYLVGYQRRFEVRAFIDDMVLRHGFVRSELETMFSRTRYNETVARLMNPSTSTKPRTWADYRGRFIEPIRLNAGVKFWREHAEDLARAENTYGVPAEIIVGIIGIETVYGRNPGKFRVIDALTTLSFDYPNKEKDRSPFFREQLEDYLIFARDGGLDVFAQRGSYAGAIGMPQFMPGSYRRFAVDFDGDGAIDLRNDASDAIGSVANFLAQHGWQRGATPYLATRLEVNADMAAVQRLIDTGSEPQWTAADLRQAGVRVPEGTAPDAKFALIDLPNGDAPTDYVLGANNFHVLTRYNRSYFYAMAVMELGAAVHARMQAGGAGSTGGSAAAPTGTLPVAPQALPKG